MSEVDEAPQRIFQGGRSHETPAAPTADHQAPTDQAVQGLADGPPADPELVRQFEFPGEPVPVEALPDPLHEQLLQLVIQRERRGRLECGFRPGTPPIRGPGSQSSRLDEDMSRDQYL